MITIAVDFDGTVVTHEYPAIGRKVPLAFETLLELQARGHNICLWTCRTGEHLTAAVVYMESEGVKLHGVNENPSSGFSTAGPKIFAHMYIDDRALGTPLVYPVHKYNDEYPWVDWQIVRKHLAERGWL